MTNNTITLSPRGAEILQNIEDIEAVKDFIKSERLKGRTIQQVSWKLNSRDFAPSLKLCKVAEIREVVRYIIANEY